MEGKESGMINVAEGSIWHNKYAAELKYVVLRRVAPGIVDHFPDGVLTYASVSRLDCKVIDTVGMSGISTITRWLEDMVLVASSVEELHDSTDPGIQESDEDRRLREYKEKNGIVTSS
jgi:hypothetical protein